MRFHATVLLVLLCALSALAQRQSLLDYAVRAWKKQPETRIADAYKWLFHATQGGEHAITSVDGPRQWLDDEWKILGKPLRDEPLMVSLRPDGKLIRVNLRPFKAAGGNKTAILTAFVSSAKRFHSDPAAFKSAWNQLGVRLRRGAIGKVTATAWATFDAEMRKDGYPACEHSSEYVKAYRPAYRVMLRSIWEARSRRSTS